MEQHSFRFKEQTNHGTIMFPFTIYDYRSDVDRTDRISCHWHEEFEILIPKYGTAQFYMNEDSFTISSDTIAVIPSNIMHLATCPIGKAFDFYAIVFHPNYISSYNNDLIQQKYIDPVINQKVLLPTLLKRDHDWEQTLFDYFHQILSLFVLKSYGYELKIKTKLLEAWVILLEHAKLQSNTTTPPHIDHRIQMTKSIMEYIKLNFEQPITLDELASQFHLSQGYLCRLFKSMTRMSPIEYLNYYRICYSTNLLDTTTQEISNIALQSGFNNISYYNRMFKKYMHLTPSQYRMHSNHQTSSFDESELPIP